MRLCWADKLGLLWAFVVYFGLFAIASDRAGMIGVFFTAEGLKLFALFILPIWVVLRLIHWTFVAPAQRR